MHLVSTDDALCHVGQINLYHNREPSSRPKVVGYRPLKGKYICILAGISYEGVCGPVVSLIFLYNHKNKN